MVVYIINGFSLPLEMTGSLPLSLQSKMTAIMNTSEILHT